MERTRLITIGFFLLAVAFVATHLFALRVALYWQVTYFDAIMHAWGGVLIALALVVLAQLPHVPLRATWTTCAGLLLVTTLSWEGFEYYTGLQAIFLYWEDTLSDILIAWASGLLTFALTRRYTIR